MPDQEKLRPQPIEWVVLFVGLVLTLRYRWLLDDAFIYFRYIDNLLFLDIGLVYNQGEYVEGFSSPLWALVLLAFRALRLDYWLMIQILGCAGFFVFWLLLVRLDRQMAPQGTRFNLPLLFLGANYAVLSYFTSGLETPLVQILGVVYALFILQPSSRGLGLMVAISPLVRHELAVPLALVGLWAWYRERRFPGFLTASAAGLIGMWMVFRIYYYADLFPNTFYLKNAANLKQGFIYLHETLTTYHVYLLAIALLAMLVWLWRQLGSSGLLLRQRLVMLIAATSVAAYVVKIGGDPRHFRYLAFPFTLAICAGGGIVTRFAAPLRAASQRIAVPIGIVALFLCGLAYPPQLDQHPVTYRERHQMVNGINDAALHRHNRRLQHENWSSRINIRILQDYRRHHEPLRYDGIGSGIRCVGMYEKFDRRMLHAFGLTDAFLARTDMEAERPAHKWGLVDMAREMIFFYRQSGGVSPGTFRRAVENGSAPDWVGDNLTTLEAIERRVYNEHDFLENLQLAFSNPGKVIPPDREPMDERLRRRMENF